MKGLLVKLKTGDPFSYIQAEPLMASELDLANL